jgi:hypothetical protein
MLPHGCKLHRSFGADTLHTGRVRDIRFDLDVGQPEDPDHTIITGLPFSDDNPGEDQVNVRLPYSLKGAGLTPVTVTVAGQQSNAVTIQIQ